MRSYDIEDDGEEVQVALFDDGIQVGGCCFPYAFGIEPILQAMEVGESWGPRVTRASTSLH